MKVNPSNYVEDIIMPDNLSKEESTKLMTPTSRRIRKLQYHWFKPGEEIPLVQFMYKPDHQEIFQDNHGFFSVPKGQPNVDIIAEIGETFPGGVVDCTILLMEFGGTFFVYCEDEEPMGGHWMIVSARNNPPIDIHYIGDLFDEREEMECWPAN